MRSSNCSLTTDVGISYFVPSTARRAITTFRSLAVHDARWSAALGRRPFIPLKVTILPSLNRLYVYVGHPRQLPPPGVSLLKRTTRRLHLTDDGAQYLERCRVILSALQEAEDALVSRRSEPEGKLTVTASALFGRRYVAPIVSNFVRQYPKVSADMLFLDRVVNLIEEGVDVGIRIAHLRDSSMMAISVGRTRRVVCASEQYLRRHGVPKKAQRSASAHVRPPCGSGTAKRMAV
jgi:hypothetical protein